MSDINKEEIIERMQRLALEHDRDNRIAYMRDTGETEWREVDEDGLENHMDFNGEAVMLVAHRPGEAIAVYLKRNSMTSVVGKLTKMEETVWAGEMHEVPFFLVPMAISKMQEEEQSEEIDLSGPPTVVPEIKYEGEPIA